MVRHRTALLFYLIILSLFVGCDRHGSSNAEFVLELMQYTSSYKEFGNRAEVYDDYIVIKVWYRPDQSEQRARQLLDKLVSIAEFKMKRRFKKRPVREELIPLKQTDLY